MSNIKKIDIRSERKRHYRSTPKRVGLEMTVTVILSEEARFCTDNNCMGYQVKPDYDSVFAGLPYSKSKGWGSNNWNSSWGDCFNEEGVKRSHHVMGSISFKFWLPADRPSEIESESEALRLITNKAPENAGKPWDERLSFEQIIDARIQHVLDDIERQQEAEHIAKQANHLVGWLTLEARKEALANTRFEARLAALKAEFETEQRNCLAKMLDGRFQTKCDDSEADWHPRAVELASQRAEENLGPAVHSFLGRSHEDAVKPQDVFPVEEKSENVAEVA